MSDFEQRLKEAAEQSVLRMVTAGGWLEPSYGSRFKIPADFTTSIWSSVDVDRLRVEIAKRIEGELADRIVNQLAAEISTDIKKVLSVKERREAIRDIARRHIVDITRLGLTPTEDSK